MKNYTNSVFLRFIFVLIGISLSYVHSVKAQDFLITINRDTLNCKMGKITNDFYPIEFKLDDELMTGMIHKDSILYYKKNMFRSLNDNRLRLWYPTVSFGINIGGSRQFGELRVGLTDGFEAKKGSSSGRNAFYAGVDLVAYLTALTGYGLKYHYRNMLGGDIQQHYVGPMIAFRFWDKEKKNHWFTHFSVGYGRMTHNNAMVKIGTKDPEPINLTANTVAGDIAAGYNLKISKHFSTQFKLSLTMAYPDYVRISDYTKVNPGGASPAPDISGYCQNMNSVNFSVGVGFH